MPTQQRVRNSARNVGASAVPPLASVHKMTPMPTSSQRELRSPSQPNSGAKSMYDTMKAVLSEPIRASTVSSMGSPAWLRGYSLGGKYVSSMSVSTAASTWRSM